MTINNSQSVQHSMPQRLSEDNKWLAYPLSSVFLLGLIGLVYAKGIGNYGVFFIAIIFTFTLILVIEQRLLESKTGVPSQFLLHINGLLIWVGTLISINLASYYNTNFEFVFILMVNYGQLLIYRSVYQCFKDKTALIMACAGVLLFLNLSFSLVMFGAGNIYSEALMISLIVILSTHYFLHSSNSSLALFYVSLNFFVFNYLAWFHGIAGFLIGLSLLLIFFFVYFYQRQNVLGSFISWALTLLVIITFHIVNYSIDFALRFHQMESSTALEINFFTGVITYIALVSHFYRLLNYDKNGKVTAQTIKKAWGIIKKKIKQTNIMVAIFTIFLLLSLFVSTDFIIFASGIATFSAFVFSVTQIFKIIRHHSKKTRLASEQVSNKFINSPFFYSANRKFFGSLSVLAYILLFYSTIYSPAIVLNYLQEHTQLPITDDHIQTVLIKDEYLWADQFPFVNNKSFFNTNPDKRQRHRLDKWSITYDDYSFKINLSNIDPMSLDLVGIKLIDLDKKEPVIVRVEPDSWADKQQLKRGDKVLCMNYWPIDNEDCKTKFHQFMPDSNFFLEDKKAYVAFEARSFNKDNTHTREMAIFHEESDLKKDVSIYEIIEMDNANVGYFYFERFSNEVIKKIDEAFSEFKKEEISELVLDLRYNPGGYVHITEYIVSAILGAEFSGKTFTQIEYNTRNSHRNYDMRVLPVKKDYATPKIVNDFITFDAIPDTSTLNLKRVVVLTTQRSCSASEWLVNGLRSFIEVVTIGGISCGKPVGSTTNVFSEKNFMMIKFQGKNQRGQGAFFGGLEPICEVEDDFSKDLGDPNEAMLSTALDWLEKEQCM